jgi:3-oxoacyl-[acyl-carrier protein] reductase
MEGKAMDLHLAGHSYLVTGGSAGLGLATAEALAADGASVTITGRDRLRLDAACQRLGSDSRGVVADNADPAAAPRLVEEIVSRTGRLDGALISVGGPPPSPVMDTDDAAWRQAFETLFIGALRLARQCVKAMPNGGAIAFVLSSSVRAPLPGLALSNGLRPGLAMAAKTLADELGPVGIRVISLVPGRIATNRTNQLDAGRPGAREASEAAIPLRRLGQAEEFGRVAAFALSPAASYLTGCVLPVDGGLIRAL